MIDRTDTHRYRDAIVYQLHVKSFFDSNGDGVGDFEGVTQKLDYIKDLGVTALWVMPIYPSPPRTMVTTSPISSGSSRPTAPCAISSCSCARRTTAASVVADLVLDHTSDQHPGSRSRARRAAHPRATTSWSDDPAGNTAARALSSSIPKPSTGPSTGRAGQYFWHRFFYPHQPDLNYDSPSLHEEMLDVARFWLNFGLDGFRCDAVPYLYERDSTNCENLPETHEFLQKLRKMRSSVIP